MFKTDTDTLILTGKSGKTYTFKMCEFDTLEMIDRACEIFTAAGLYVFAYRHNKPGDSRNWYDLKYIGETEDYSQRDYSNHHKKDEIIKSNSDARGYCITINSDDERKEIEKDLIDRYNPPCNG